MASLALVLGLGLALALAPALAPALALPPGLAKGKTSRLCWLCWLDVEARLSVQPLLS